MRISDWSSDVCSSDLHFAHQLQREEVREDQAENAVLHQLAQHVDAQFAQLVLVDHLEAAIDIGLVMAFLLATDFALHPQVGLFPPVPAHAGALAGFLELLSLLTHELELVLPLHNPKTSAKRQA